MPTNRRSHRDDAVEAALVESSGEFRFGDDREMEFKGLAGTHQVFEVNLP